MRFFLLLLFFYIQYISAVPVYFNCEAKTYTNYTKGEWGDYSDGDLIKSLIVDKESKKVNWDSTELIFVPDFNEDGIFQFYNSGKNEYDLRFNFVTLSLDETHRNSLLNSHLARTYVCNKTVPAF